MSDADPNRPRRRTITSFAVLFACAGLLIGFWSWARHQGEIDGIQAPFRKILSWNGALWSGIYGPSKLSSARAPAPGTPVRVNGDVGLESPLDLANWKVAIDHDGGRTLSLGMAEIRALPKADTASEFRCIEGWSETVSYGGARFSDFMRAYGLGRRSGKAWEGQGTPEDLYPYVGLVTPDGQYYVSIDMESMLHPQTVLAYEMNGKELSSENGAPLRLVIPVKYGIKSLKRIGRIFFSDRRPPDYWEQQGYDWFAGL